MKNKVFNLTPHHFEIKKGVLIFYGRRGEDPSYEKHIFEVRIHFSSLFWFCLLGEEIMEHLKEKSKEIQKFIYRIKNH